ncbi:hypothetical protein [Streptomyces sp. NPDC003697]
MTDFLSYESLQWGARKFAHTAMDAHSRNDEEVFLLHAGVSIERLAKSALSKHSPFLLLEMKGKEDYFGLHMQCGLYSFHSPKECAACHCRGRLIVNLPLIGTGPAEGFPDRWFYCPLCAFSAHGDDELAACGIAENELFLSSLGEPIQLDESMFAEFVSLGLLDGSEVAMVVSHFSTGASTD